MQAGQDGQDSQWLKQRLDGVDSSSTAVAETLGVSAGNGAGLDLLLGVLESKVAAAAGKQDGEGALITRQAFDLSCRALVFSCTKALHAINSETHEAIEARFSLQF